MSKLKKILKNTYTPIIIITLIFSAILGTISSAVAQNGNYQGPPTGMESTIPIKITNITFSDDNPTEGDEITISSNVMNNGPTPIRNVTITFYRDYEELRNVTDITLEANSSTIVEITWLAEKWNHNISVMASIEDTPLKGTTTSKEIYVNAKPIGDIFTLIYALILIILVVLGTTIVPSIFGKLIGEGSKKGM